MSPDEEVLSKISNQLRLSLFALLTFTAIFFYSEVPDEKGRKENNALIRDVISKVETYNNRVAPAVASLKKAMNQGYFYFLRDCGFIDLNSLSINVLEVKLELCAKEALHHSILNRIEMESIYGDVRELTEDEFLSFASYNLDFDASHRAIIVTIFHDDAKDNHKDFLEAYGNEIISELNFGKIQSRYNVWGISIKSDHIVWVSAALILLIQLYMVGFCKELRLISRDCLVFPRDFIVFHRSKISVFIFISFLCIPSTVLLVAALKPIKFNDGFDIFYTGFLCLVLFSPLMFNIYNLLQSRKLSFEERIVEKQKNRYSLTCKNTNRRKLSE